ncbi:MAG: glycosyltransferase [Pyrinomonadaceae bacterium]
MYFFYCLAVIVVWLGVLSLRGGFRFENYLKNESEKDPPDFTPFVSVIAPCRGLDQGFNENISALFQQQYPAYEILFVTDRADDGSVAAIEKILSLQQNVSARLIVAGEATDSGQKVHNLRVATGQIASNSEVLVFVDSDARPDADWLRSLVAPLANTGLGAATGYRWFVPVNGALAGYLRSVWNASIASALGQDTGKNFCWGGSTAIRRTVFEKLGVRERWIGTVSDDFTVTRILQEAKLPIHFVPAC